MTRGTTFDEIDSNNIGSQPSPRQPARVNKGNSSTKPHVMQINNSPLLQPLVMHFTAVVQVIKYVNYVNNYLYFISNIF